MRRVVGALASAGLVVFGCGLAGVLVVEVLGVGDAGRTIATTVLLAGLGVVLVVWPLWGTVSLLREGASVGGSRWAEPLPGALLVLGAIAAGAGFAVGNLAHAGVEWAEPVGAPALLIGIAIVAVALGIAAVATGVLLGGAAWWWVGVLLVAGVAGIAIGILVEAAPLVAVGIALVVASFVGYAAAARVGRGRRTTTTASERS